MSMRTVIIRAPGSPGSQRAIRWSSPSWPSCASSIAMVAVTVFVALAIGTMVSLVIAPPRPPLARP